LQTLPLIYAFPAFRLGSDIEECPVRPFKTVTVQLLTSPSGSTDDALELLTDPLPLRLVDVDDGVLVAPDPLPPLLFGVDISSSTVVATEDSDASVSASEGALRDLLPILADFRSRTCSAASIASTVDLSREDVADGVGVAPVSSAVFDTSPFRITH
jgi:glycine/D-amino acid oxidase-like deaminating enzyme